MVGSQQRANRAKTRVSILLQGQNWIILLLVVAVMVLMTMVVQMNEWPLIQLYIVYKNSCIRRKVEQELGQKNWMYIFFSLCRKWDLLIFPLKLLRVWFSFLGVFRCRIYILQTGINIFIFYLLWLDQMKTAYGFTDWIYVGFFCSKLCQFNIVFKNVQELN